MVKKVSINFLIANSDVQLSKIEKLIPLMKFYNLNYSYVEFKKNKKSRANEILIIIKPYCILFLRNYDIIRDILFIYVDWAWVHGGNIL